MQAMQKPRRENLTKVRKEGFFFDGFRQAYQTTSILKKQCCCKTWKLFFLIARKKISRGSKRSDKAENGLLCPHSLSFKTKQKRFFPSYTFWGKEKLFSCSGGIERLFFSVTISACLHSVLQSSGNRKSQNTKPNLNTIRPYKMWQFFNLANFLAIYIFMQVKIAFFAKWFSHVCILFCNLQDVEKSKKKKNFHTIYKWRNW